jgi:hypothetical protein
MADELDDTDALLARLNMSPFPPAGFATRHTGRSYGATGCPGISRVHRGQTIACLAIRDRQNGHLFCEYADQASQKVGTPMKRARRNMNAKKSTIASLLIISADPCRNPFLSLSRAGHQGNRSSTAIWPTTVPSKTTETCSPDR